MFHKFLGNHVLANLTFAMVVVLGSLAYMSMPREQDPEVNFNWIDITTVLPGAAATDVESRVTDVLEDAVRKISDIKFVSSVSRESISSVLLRFEDIDSNTFDKRVTDLRREVQAIQDQFPEQTEDPRILEITSANAFPTAMVAVVGPADDENLRWQARLIKEDIERLKGVDSVMASGLLDPELQVRFDPDQLANLGIKPTQIADTVAAYFRDVAAGSIQVDQENWLVRLVGSSADPGMLAQLPIVGSEHQLPLGSVAQVARGRAQADRIVRINGQPAVLLSINKKAGTNTLELVERIRELVDQGNTSAVQVGVQLMLVDDQTEITRNAIRIMESNALLGFVLVLLVSWVFLGTRMAFLTCLCIPFVIAGTFWVLSGMDQTLNVSILLGAVIALGMLVDDSVVVAEAVYYRWQRGQEVMAATVDALREVFAPVTTSVLTTLAAFLPLLLLPGIIGKFMSIIPLVVTTALIISLAEAYWLLPAHMLAMLGSPARGKTTGQSGHQQRHWRQRMLHKIRLVYSRVLIKTLRYPKLTALAVFLLFAGTLSLLAQNKIRVDFFASDPLRLFYVNVEMPIGTPLNTTLTEVEQLNQQISALLTKDETRSVLGYAGLMVTEVAPFFGDRYGQITVSLATKTPERRDVDTVINAIRPVLDAYQGAAKLSILRMAGGPPVTKAVSVKIRGTELQELQAAATRLKDYLAANPAFRDVTDDSAPGQRTLSLRINTDAAQRAGVDPVSLARSLRLLVDGEVVADMQDRGEKLEVRIRSSQERLDNIDQLLTVRLPTAYGTSVALAELVERDYSRSPEAIRHYNFRRAVTVEADINKDYRVNDEQPLNEVSANQLIRDYWQQNLQSEYPTLDLDFSGLLDDLNESLDSMKVLFLFGVLLMYLILGTQFKSYFQPILILSTVPMAFTGVILGLWISDNPLSLFALYGVIALAGVAVNSAIVLISTANDRLAAGMSLLHATVYAGRRRVVPIMITSLTTIAGLFALATGMGGHSLIWGPVAAAIVWGLLFSTLLTLLVVPMLYRAFMRYSHLVKQSQTAQKLHGP